MVGHVTFDAKKVEEFRKAYVNAKENKAESFFFEGGEYLVSYAKYLLEYLDTKFKK